MDLNLEWRKPFRLRRTGEVGTPYRCVDFDRLPRTPGIYVFARMHGGVVNPIYIGQATRIRGRVRQQLNNGRLMGAVHAMPQGRRVLLVAEYKAKGGQNRKKALNLIERGLIRAALTDGYDLVNIQGTKVRAHTITSRGNREARGWLTGTLHLEKRK